MTEKLKTFIKSINPFDIPDLVRDSHKDIKELKQLQHNKMKRINELEKKLLIEREVKEKEQALLLSVINHLDDMVWAKDTSGKYIMCNEAFRDKFCYGFSWEQIKGKTDDDLAKEFKDLVGKDNHTFGDTCTYSDEIVLKNQEAKQFLEHGLINGKLVKLVVNKSPVFNYDGVLFAICGTGRDVTEWHDGLETAMASCQSCFDEEAINLLKAKLNKYTFEAGEHVN
jgi:PAS domain-containing protein